jgi:DNA-binding CsgD family transcriptional regulator
MLSLAQQEASKRLWDELADFPASAADDALLHLMRTMSGWMASGDVAWIGMVRLQRDTKARNDPQHGWRALAVRRLNPAPVIAARSQRAVRDQDTAPPMTTTAATAGAGHLRVRRLHDGFVDLRAFKKTEPYRLLYEEPGISDRMFAGIPIHNDAETYVLFDRYGDARRFSKNDADWASFTMRGLKWFFRELMLSHGLLVAREPLVLMERRIVRLLLTELTEKEIAAELGHSPQTTHKYITAILRKFGVRGRTGLMALWLGRRA